MFAIIYIIASAVLFQRYYRYAKASQSESEILANYNLARLFALVATLGVSRYLLEEYSRKKDNNLLQSRVWLHSILHLLPIAHIISNIIVYKTVQTIMPDIKN